MLEIQMYDDVVLKNGVEGCVVDRSNPNDTGDDDVFIVDVGDSPETWETISVKRGEIDRVTAHHPV